jgi:ATP-dependent RNA helicase RhlE
VINHDLPMVAEDYIHRIGRTGRAGATGEALSLVSPEEGGLLRQIQRMLNAEIVMDVVAGYEPSRPIRLDTPIPSNGGRGQKPGGQRPPARPAHRAHGKPQARGPQAHAGPKQHRGGRAGSSAGGGRRDTRA